MFKRLCCLLLLLFFPLSALADPALDDALTALFARHGTVGGVVAVGYRGELVYHLDYGVTDRQAQTPVTPDTIFKTASVTKMVTAIRLMQLVEDGLVDLDAPIGTYLGYDVRHPRFGTDVTLRMLMSHTSGLSGNVPTGQSLQKLLSRRASWASWAPGSKYRYSNFAGVMGSVIEAVTGDDLNTSMQEALFSPLGIDAAYRVHLLAQPAHASLRYNAKGLLARARNFYPTEAWNGLCDPDHHYDLAIGDLWIRGDDLCRLGMMMCGDGNLDGRILLTPETVAEMTSSQLDLGGITTDSPYGLSVHRISDLVPGRMVYGHQGHSEGILANLYWEPETGLVFALITNGCNVQLDNYISTLSREAFKAVWQAYAAD